MKVRSTNLCRTCRRRKITCDAKRPGCSQCVNSGRSCEGYPEALFVPWQSKSKPEQKASPKRNANKRSPCSNLSTSRALVESNSVSPDIMPIYPCLKDSWENTISLIIRNYVPKNEIITDITEIVPKSPRICGSWVSALPTLAAGSSGIFGECLTSSMNALALSITSYNTGKQLTKHISLSYVHALSLLQKDLRTSGTCYNAEQVAAVMCIALLEVSSPTSPGSWLVHIHGVGELIRLSTPDLFSTGIQHKMFIGIRPLIVLQAMLCRKSTFLANEAWIKKPFEFHKQSTLQNLLDLAVSIPGILEDIDALNDQPADTVSNAAKTSMTQLVNIIMKLESWANDFEAESSTPQYEDPQNQHGTLRYPNLTTANTFTHLWAFQIICMSHIKSLLARFPELSGFEIILPLSALRKSCIELSTKILQSMKYLTQKEFLLYGRFSVWLPLNTAYHSLNADQEGIAVLQNLATSAIRDINVEMKSHFSNIRGEWMIRPK